MGLQFYNINKAVPSNKHIRVKNVVRTTPSVKTVLKNKSKQNKKDSLLSASNLSFLHSLNAL